MFINKLSDTLKQHLNFNKARSDCLAQLIRAILLVKTVNLTHIANAFESKALVSSSYKRIQRFFSSFDFNLLLLAPMILFLLGLSKGKLTLALDRTNWKLGKLNINILMLSVVYHNMSFPLVWNCLPKKGNSNTSERKNIIWQVLEYIGAKRIDCLLGDREFIGEEWFEFLNQEKIPFLFRVRNNSLLEGKVPINIFFKSLSYKKKVENNKTILWNKPLFFSVRWSHKKDELVSLVSNYEFQEPFQKYKMRWSIETFFACLKTRGFCLEDTHLIHLDRIEKLVAVLAIAFTWSFLVGQQKNSSMPIKTKTHGRKAKSIFRYGFDELRKLFFSMNDEITTAMKWLGLLFKPHIPQV